MHNLQRYHVAAGSYTVDRSKPMVLTAALGTCVGLAVYDRTTGAGGLIHLLLSEPRTPVGAFQPEKYASTGLPLFLDALVAAGAVTENLQACIAGGALVGPVQGVDLELDIGGKTTETVTNFLAARNIPVEKSETGGFFTCRLTLNMQTWQCEIEPGGYDKLSPNQHTQLPATDDVRKAIHDLQPIPQVALKILRLINEDLYELNDLTEEIRKDQVLGARTLKLCNSVMFGSRNRIDSLDQALVYLGQKLLIKFVISASVNNFFTQAGNGYSLCKGGIYHHAVGTAVIAEKLAQVTGKTPPTLAYTAGLLHDIGKVVLDQYIHSAFPLFYRQIHEEDNNFLAIEKEILGIDHTQVGIELARTWSFPESLIEVINYHHWPENAQQNIELVHIVYLADLLMSRFHSGLEIERLNTDALAARLETIGLSLAGFADIVDLIPGKVLDLSTEMTMMTG
jgi:putative nucleotidyltransferase with HDIG domain